MTLQNGMGNADTIAATMESNRILVGTTSHGATLLGAGNIRHAGKGQTTIGIWGEADPESTTTRNAGGLGFTAIGGKRQGSEAPQIVENNAVWKAQFKIVRQTADLFTQAGIETTAVRDVRAVIWNKLLVNVGINAITALTGIKNGQILDLESTRARTQGIKINEDPISHVFQIAAATAPNRSSMGQDVDHRRPTEIGSINGFVVREAGRMGLAAPVNRTLTALVETMEAHYKD
jgi:2-dehydropantoate 2-reductase